MAGQGGIGRRTAAPIIVLVLQAAVCLVLLVVPLSSRPHHAPVTISAPAVVADTLAQRVNERPDQLLTAGGVESEREARRDVERGRAVAALSVDLVLNRATLFVSSAQDESLTDAVSAAVAAMAAPFAVEVTTRDVAPLPDGSVGQGGLKLAVAVAVGLGLVFAIAVTWWRGPVADEWSHARMRIGAALTVAAVASLAVAVLAGAQVGGSVVGWWLVLAITMLATSAATLALAGVLGVGGVGFATLVFVVSAAPLIRVGHPLLLPTPWRQVTPWLPHGAGLDAARQVAWFDGAGTVRPVVVLLGWLAVSCVVLAVSRRERRRAGVDLRSVVTAR